jgi:hypothetical protein
VRLARRSGWSTALALAVLALGLVGVALAGVTKDVATTPSVKVTFTDTKLVVSHGVVEAGAATFVVANKSHRPRVFTISGPGMRNGRIQKISSGKSAKLTVTLRKGAYMLADQDPRSPAAIRWLLVGPATASSGSKREVLPFPPPVPMDCD